MSLNEHLERLIKDEVQESIDVKAALLSDAELVDTIKQVITLCVETFHQGGKILIAGNGGSAADAQHIAAEFVSRFYFDRPALPAIALTTDTSALTAIGNDYGFERLFSRQVEALGKAGDLLIAISTSGNSDNILNGLRSAQRLGIKTLALTSTRDQKMVEVSDLRIAVPSASTPRIQEAHILIGHIICGVVESLMFSRDHEPS
jgi:D-sedoheptulose 7-phosphate isomerase